MDLNTLKDQAQKAMSNVSASALNNEAVSEITAGLKDAAMAAKDKAMATEGSIKDKLAGGAEAFKEKAGDLLGDLGSKVTGLADKLK